MNSLYDITWKRDQLDGRKGKGNRRDQEPMDADKLDKQLENYWTKHGKINKIDSNIWWFFKSIKSN